MKKTLIVGILIVLLLEICSIPSTKSVVKEISSPPVFDGNTLYVGGTGPNNYTKIQDAIDNASDGDTVFVFNGTYYENVIVTKSIDLLGEDKNSTIIDGNRTGDVVSLTANGVNIKGFAIQNSGSNWYEAGIHINSENNIISNNIIKNSTQGIYLYGYSQNTIAENIITNNVQNGIRNGRILMGDLLSHDIAIYKNTIKHNKYGIEYALSNNGIISQNIVEDNYGSGGSGRGIILWNSNNNIISKNTVSNNTGTGIYLFEICCNNIVTANIVSNNSEEGIHIDMSSHDTITKNLITYSPLGIGFSGSASFNTICENHIANNIVGVSVPQYHQGNIFFHNNLIQPQFNAYDYSTEYYQNVWNDSYPSGGNHWSNYQGSDNFHGPNQNIPGSDGIGDTPYNVPGGISQDNYPLMEPLNIIMNNPPYQPDDPEPANGSTDVDINTDLSWTGGDIDADKVTYDVYFDISTPPVLVAANITDTIYDPGTLNFKTQYYWKIVAWDSGGASTQGTLWSFITENDTIPPSIQIIKPEKALYINNKKILPFFTPFIIGNIEIEVNASDEQSEIDRVEFWIDDEYKGNDTTLTYNWTWDERTPFRFRHTIKVIAYDAVENNATDKKEVWKFF